MSTTATKEISGDQRKSRPMLIRILVIVCLLAVGLWGLAVASMYFVVAAYSRGSDVEAWLLFGTASAVSVGICVWTIARIRRIGLWWAVAAVLLAALASTPGTLLIEGLARHPI
jgi:hypothetical protein